VKNNRDKNKKEGFSKVKNNSVEGIIRISHKGIGKVTVKETDEIVEIPHNFLRTALHGDSVKIILHPKKKKESQTGEVTKIIRRSKKGFSGILESRDNIYFLIPSDL
jgi:ribonuclease R